MALIIELSHPLGGRTVDAASFWYGFVVHHLVQDESTKAHVRSYHIQEIEAIGLSSSEDARKIGGFYWPVEHWKRLSAEGQIDKNTVSRGLYVALDEVEIAFPSLRNISQVDLLIGRKGGVYALMQSGAAPLVTLYRDGKSQVIKIPEEILSDQSAVLSLYARDQVLLPIESPRWRGQGSFASGIDGFLVALSIQATANEVLTEKTASKAVAEPVLRSKAELPDAGFTANPRDLVKPTVENKELEPSSTRGMSASAPQVHDKEPIKSNAWIWVAAIATVGMLGIVGVLFLKPTDVLQVSTQQVLPVPATQLSASGPQTGESKPVLPVPIPSRDVTAESIVASIAVPTGNWPVSRDELYKFGFDSQLGLVKQILDASKTADVASFDVGTEQLSAMRPAREWPKDDLAGRRKFNEGIEALIGVAIKTSNEQALSKAIDLSEQFLTTHFGNSTAHLNLSLAQSAANRGKAALPPAIHTIIFNPDGANSWVALGIALARSGDEAGSTSAFCTALRKVNFSEKTVSFFERIGRGEDAVYSYPEVIRSIKATSLMCPRERWARSVSLAR